MSSLARRPATWAVALLASLAYLPALTAAPGRMPSDSKLYLYLDPGRFMGDAASTFDPRQYAGWVPHQHVAYLWPAGPWFWLFDVLSVPDWVAHRLWIGSLMVAAGLGVRWASRQLGLGQAAALTAAVVYQVSPYVLPYVSRTSVMLLPWAGLGWIVGLTVRATRRRTWGDPAMIALVVLTVGAVNATALAMIIPAPVLWIVHAVWQRSIGWRQALMVGARVAVLTIPVCLWWIAMLVIQGASGAELLPYSESLADVSLTATAGEVWRGLGYWLFYVRDPYAATTTESLRYLSSTPAIVVSYAVPIVCVAGLLFVRWAHRRFAALLIAAGAVLAVGVHPIGDRSPLMRVLAGDDEAGLALALRSSTRALPVMTLGLALLAGALVSSLASWRPTWRPGSSTWARTDLAVGGLVCAVAIVNLPALWTGGFVDPALERDQDPPDAWIEAAASLDSGPGQARVLQVPGAEFGAYRWGYTVDQPLPGIADEPVVTRDLLPLGSPAAMDLLYAFDDRIQDGVLEAPAVAPVARWLGVDTIWLTNDLAYDRFRTARPRVLGAQLGTAPGLGEPSSWGPPGGDHPTVAMTDEQSLGDPSANAPVSPVALYPVEEPGSVVRAGDRTTVVSGSGDGLVDAAAAGLLDGSSVVRYSASMTADELAALDRSTPLIVTDSNRDRARHWRSSQDTTGYTESDQPDLELLRHVASDQRLPVFADRDDPVDPATQTIARQIGPVRATATSYGEPFAYLPERRPLMAVDGNLGTAWTVGEHADPIGETLRLLFDEPVTDLSLVQHDSGGRRITAITLSTPLDDWPDGTTRTETVELDDRSLMPDGQPIELLGEVTIVDVTITAVGGGEPSTAGAVAGVGIAEVVTGRQPTIEVVRPPHDALAVVPDEVPLTIELTRQRAQPTDRWRSDPEPALVRQVELAGARTMQPAVEVRVDPRADDRALAEMFGWPAWASSRLTGSIRNAGVAALDGDTSTAWITGFGEALGATLTIESVATPIDRISVSQPVGGFSAVTAITVRSGGEERTVDLRPDAAGTATAVVDPPLPAGTVDVVIAAIDEATTIDRRYADVVELPAAIAEISLPGRTVLASIASVQRTIECTPLLTVDDQPLAFRFTIDGESVLDGRSLRAEPCDGSVSLATGSHLIVAIDSDLAIDVDRVVLAPTEVPESATTTPTTRLLRNDKFDREIQVTGCPEGCWLVFGEGYNTAWTASSGGTSLGEPELVDGGFNGWWLPGSSEPVTVDVHWTRQGRLDVAVAISIVGALVAIGLVVFDRRRRAGNAVAETLVETMADDAQRPTFGVGAALTLDRALVVAVAWTILAGLLIAPRWALWGAIAGVVVVLVRRLRVVELISLGTLTVVAGLVVLRERRNAPAPNGGWPSVFESWHRLALFAVVGVAVAAVAATDAEPTASVADEHEGDRRRTGDEGDQVG